MIEVIRTRSIFVAAKKYILVDLSVIVRYPAVALPHLVIQMLSTNLAVSYVLT